MSRRARALALVFVLSACGRVGDKIFGTGGDAETPGANPSAATGNINAPAAPNPSKPHPYQGIGFSPSSVDPTAVALTFDDGPDEHGHTAAVLDALKALNLKATFFINSNNWSDVSTSATAQALVRRMVQEGHTLGNHSVDHKNFTTLDEASLDAELTGVETTVATILGQSAPPLTLVRVPFGKPLQHPDSFPSDVVRRVQNVVARHGIHVGWVLDGKDAGASAGECDNAPCVVAKVQADLAAGGRGILLLHSTAQTATHIAAEALPQVVMAIQAAGLHIVSVEDLVRGELGASSATLMGHPTPPANP